MAFALDAELITSNNSILQWAKRNMLSAESHLAVIEKYLREELAHDWLIELHPPFTVRVCVSKFGAIP